MLVPQSGIPASDAVGTSSRLGRGSYRDPDNRVAT